VSRKFIFNLPVLTDLIHRWDYVQRHRVQLPDEYDQIHHDIEPFWGIRPADLRKLQAEHEAEMGTYTLGNGQGFGPIEVVNTTLTPDAVDVANKRSNDQLDILDPVKQWIPPFRATFTVSIPKLLVLLRAINELQCHDAPILFVGHDLRSEAIDAAAVRECGFLSSRFASSAYPISRYRHQQALGRSTPRLGFRLSGKLPTACGC